MIRRLIFLSLACCAFVSVASAQTGGDSLTFKLQRSIAVKALNFEVDNLGNIYFINQNQLLKIDQALDTIFTYSSLRYGSPTSIDVSNPLKLLVFYKNYGIIQLLDRQLALKYSIDLHQLNIFFPAAIALAADGNIWLFDEQDGKLKKLDINGKVLQQSVDMRQLAPALPHPDRIIENNNLVYMNDPAQGIFVFDNYATFRNQLLFTGIQSLSIFGNQLVYWQDTQLFAYNMRSFSTQSVLLPQAKDISQVRVMKDSLYILTKSQLNIYSLK